MSIKHNGFSIPQVATIPIVPRPVTSRAIINAGNVWLKKRGLPVNIAPASARNSKEPGNDR
jgi:hypothetical protein